MLSDKLMKEFIRTRSLDFFNWYREMFSVPLEEKNIELFENITGVRFVKPDVSKMGDRIEQNVLQFLKNQ